ncbi:xanthine dehydrogenase family protein molybdopterin-binding subunit [Aminobacter niigataensis]|uniref:xanthine dehydrogenase family protein molybdopterin-binding subunit n=1 Tax=Aminobacter niigataensis TaxID=83265 RepID=UPI0024CBE277|nr:xanthine dehydrogenase family protein molybdopterin-binding subunit [Aminobacter niigataensis]CAI2931846.1 Ald_Xan_dh_C domain-containing protein [Aminobacter niigataensis]
MNAIGLGLPRPDAHAKVSGETIFSFDFAEPGTLAGKILRSKVPAGRIISIDVSKALSIPGVRAVITASDMPSVLGGWIIRDTPMFAREVVRYIGEPIAAVAADSVDCALRAVEAIVVEIEPTQAVCTIEDAIARGAPLVHPDLKNYRMAAGGEGGDYLRYGNIAAESASQGTDAQVDAEFARAFRVVEDVYSTQRQYQAYIEPRNAVGIYRGGRYIAHTGSQWPYNVRNRISQFFDVPISKVRVAGHPYGGGFGGKLDFSVEPYAIALSRACRGRPVKIVNTRHEDIITAPCREATVIKFRSALDAEGNILARDVECYMDNGAYTGEMSFLTCFPFHFAAINYRVGKLRAVGRLVYTNAAPTAAMRGVTGVPMYFALENHMDHIASELNVDRREYRLRHLFRSGDRMSNGQTLDDADILRKQFDAIEAIAPWNDIQSSKAPLHGIAISPAIWPTNPLPGSATVKLQEDGSVVVVTGANDNGSGAVETGIRQIVAHELGIDPNNVLMSDPDTDVGGFDGGSQGQRTTLVAGGAALAAAKDLKAKIIALAAKLLQCEPDMIELVDQQARIRHRPDVFVSLAELGATSTFSEGSLYGAGGSSIQPVAHDNGCASGMLAPVFNSPTYHVHFAEVAVDPVTGNVKVLRYIVAQEVGMAINPKSIAGQIQGGVTQGIGYALYESLRLSPTTGAPIEQGLESYRLPLSVDIPRVEIILTEHHNPNGPFGAKGVAEAPILLPAAVIASAISDAIGKPFFKVPVTPEDVLAALLADEPT